jgi:hypothetical protein
MSYVISTGNEAGLEGTDWSQREIADEAIRRGLV